ncbi:MAG: mycothiol synthase [Actinomycetota bacterium]
MRIRPLRLPEDRQPVLEFLRGRRTQLSENKHAFLEPGDGRRGAGILAESGGSPAGYAGLAPASAQAEWAMELVADREAVDPLAEAAMEEALRRGARRLRWWTYDEASTGYPRRHGFRPERELLRMGRALPANEAPVWGAARVAGFRPGTDEDAWLEVNNAAFAGHPENGSLTVEDLARRMRTRWFDPEGLRMAWEKGRLAGFCWTKVHGREEGEIYIIGVHPRFQGRGLGRALVLEGMRWLSDHGCDRVFLYTEGSNRGAVALYRDLGFQVERIHRAFTRDLGA